MIRHYSRLNISAGINKSGAAKKEYILHPGEDTELKSGIVKEDCSVFAYEIVNGKVDNEDTMLELKKGQRITVKKYNTYDVLTVESGKSASRNHRAWTDSDGEEYYDTYIQQDDYYGYQKQDIKDIVFDLVDAAYRDDYSDGITSHYDKVIESLDLDRDLITHIMNELIYYKNPNIPERIVQKVLRDFEVGGRADMLRRRKKSSLHKADGLCKTFEEFVRKEKLTPEDVIDMIQDSNKGQGSTGVLMQMLQEDGEMTEDASPYEIDEYLEDNGYVQDYMGNWTEEDDDDFFEE